MQQTLFMGVLKIVNRSANGRAGRIDESLAPIAPRPQLSESPSSALVADAFVETAVRRIPDRGRLLAPGTCVAGRYIICDVLGVGGTAVVYAAEQVALKRVVAFKVYPASEELKAQRTRLEREAHILARVQHDNVVAVFDAGQLPDGSLFLVVQRLSGQSLAQRLTEGPLPIRESVELALQVLDALLALHDAGITHRDIKPENLVLEHPCEGRPVIKLVDFGIAKLVQDEGWHEPEKMVGTPGYMPPEQICGGIIDGRSDLYGLGATLYDMLSGSAPHAGATLRETIDSTLHGKPRPLSQLRPDCPEGLARIVMKALAVNPADRFGSAREMKYALKGLELGFRAQPQPRRTAPASALERREPLPRARRLRTVRAAFLVAGASVVLGGAAVFVAQRDGLTSSEHLESRRGEPTLGVSERLVNERVERVGDAASDLVAQLGTSASELSDWAHASARRWLGPPKRALDRPSSLPF